MRPDPDYDNPKYKFNMTNYFIALKKDLKTYTPATIVVEVVRILVFVFLCIATVLTYLKGDNENAFCLLICALFVLGSKFYFVWVDYAPQRPPSYE